MKKKLLIGAALILSVGMACTQEPVIGRVTAVTNG